MPIEPTRVPRSRRDRPAKPALSRQGIVDAALDILRREGLAKVTMRRVAAELDTGAASLYVYVHNTEDLHAAVLDELLGPVATAAGAGPWQARVKQVLTSYLETLLRYPELARITMFTQPSGPHYLALVEQLLRLLTDGGVSDGDAAWAVDVLLLIPTAVAAEQGGRRTAARPGEDFAALQVELATADPARYPLVGRLGEQLVSGTGQQRFAWTLDLVLTGLTVAGDRRAGNDT